MPTVKLSFNLPEEQDQFEDALNGGRWRSFAQEFSQVMKSHIKHKGIDSVEEVEGIFIELLEDSDLDLWD